MAPILWTAVVLVHSACARPEPASSGGDVGANHAGATNDTAAPTTMTAQDSLAARLEPGALKTVASAPVVGWTGPGGRPFEVAVRTAEPMSAHARPFGSVTLGTALRKRSPNLGQFPCTACHMGRRIELRDERIADAHRNIRLEHPKLAGATCSTCHAADNVEQLALKTGDRVTMDHTYRLCAQCHYTRAEGWAGGGHGKRLDGWQGRRVVMGCADCHDPHNPSIEKRIPFRAPRLERTGSPR